jgi:hypothetical protein
LAIAFNSFSRRSIAGVHMWPSPVRSVLSTQRQLASKMSPPRPLVNHITYHINHYNI